MNTTKSFEYKELDQEGLEILDVISNANKFNHWMYETIAPFCGDEILEIGSGIGNISKFFLLEKNDIRLDLSDIRENYRDYLTKNVIKNHKNSSVINMDIVDPHFDEIHKNKLNTYDTVFSLNVVEHIEDDKLALENAQKLLKKGGKLVILVPAYQWLYNDFDRTLEHYRRYTTSRLEKVFPSNMSIIHKQYFNAVGMAGWFFTGSILRKKSIPGGQMSLYNTLVPIFKIIDKVILNSFGLSAIVVGQKK